MSLTAAEIYGKLLDFLRARKRHYQNAFGSPSGQAVLVDLASFCRANETAVYTDKGGKIDKDMTMMLEGRREVWLRIQQHIGLSSDQLLRLYNGQAAVNPGEDDDG